MVCKVDRNSQFQHYNVQKIDIMTENYVRKPCYSF